jgi:hypothetical protein
MGLVIGLCNGNDLGELFCELFKLGLLYNDYLNLILIKE